MRRRNPNLREATVCRSGPERRLHRVRKANLRRLRSGTQGTRRAVGSCVMLHTFYNTGARVSEIIRIHREDVRLEDAYVLIHGKGRKERAVPLWKTTVQQLGRWLRWVAAGQDAPVFPNRRGGALSRVGVAKRVQIAAQRAAEKCPTLRGRRISPHVLRHTTAMHLLQSRVDITVIALWLGGACQGE
jgi:integrase/recombinase XerD